ICPLVSSFFFSSRRRHTRFSRDWSSDVCSSDLTGNGAHLDGVRTSGTAGQASGLLQQHRSRGAFGFKGEAAVAVNSDDHRSRQTGFHALGLGVERLAELHDVHAVLAQSGTDGRRRVGLAGLYLQLDVSLNLLSHELLQFRVKRLDEAPRLMTHLSQ